MHMILLDILDHILGTMYKVKSLKPVLNWRGGRGRGRGGGE